MRHLVPAMRLTLFALLVATPPAVAVEGQWRVLGPDGGSVYDLVIKPDDPQVMYAAVHGGVFKTIDGGATWSWSGSGLYAPAAVLALAIDPVRPATIYAAHAGNLYKSVNGGQTWRFTGVPATYGVAVHPRASGTVFTAAEQGLFRSLDGGATWKRLTRRLPDPARATLILFDPTSANRLYASLQDPDFEEGGLFRSLDGGVSWRPIHGGPLNNQQIFALAIAPRSPETLYAATSDRVFKSTDGGATWKSAGLTGVGSIWTLAADPRRSGVVYAGTETGLFRSRNGGATWARLSRGLPQPGGVFTLAFHPASRTLYAGVATPFERGGVFASADEGSSWSFSSRGLFALAIDSMAIDSRDPSVLWTTANTVPFKSTDRGQTWVRVRPDPGAGDVRATRVAIDPLDPGTVYVMLPNGGLRRSHDGGQSWELARNPGVAPFGNASIVIDPQTPTTIYIAGVGIAKSIDGGNTWAHFGGDPADMVFFDLEISPTSPSTLYGTGGGGSGGNRVVRTTDGGATWSQIQQGLPQHPFDLAVDPVLSTTLYAVADDIVYESADGGATWSVFSSAFQDGTLLEVAASPSTSGLVYAPVWFDNVYQNVDGGADWEPLGRSPLGAVYTTVTEDPTDPCRIYVGTANWGLLEFTKADC